MPIADDLLRNKMIHPEVYSNIQTANTSQDQMRELYKALKSGGPEVKSAFYRSLLKQDRYLVEDLGTFLSLPLDSSVIYKTTVM